jgi:hypothetical protein
VELGDGRSGRVAVEHRFLGLDKRTLPLALVVAGLWLLWAVILPWVEGGVAWDDPIRPGDRVRLTDEVSFAPTTGWGLTRGLRTSDSPASGDKSTPSVTVQKDGISLIARQGAWDGTPRALLNRITKLTTTESGGEDFHLTTGTTTIHTSSGETGVLEGFRSPRVEGLVAAFVFDGQGVQIQAVGPPGQLARHSKDIGRMLASVRQERVDQ